MNDSIELEWHGNKWDLNHARDFYRKGKWTLEFAANWLGIPEAEFHKLIIKKCPKCLGTGRLYR